jgi:hypothetical protein
MMPRMRTIPEAIREIKEHDPHSGISATLLRKLVKQGVLKTLRPGESTPFTVNSMWTRRHVIT